MIGPSDDLRDELLELYSAIVTLSLSATPILRGQEFFSPRSELVFLNEQLVRVEEQIAKVREAARQTLDAIQKSPAYTANVD